MPPVKSNKQPRAGVPGVKMLIMATSLAATVGGWALISAKETKPAPSAPLTQPTTAAQVPAPVLSIKFAPLPTLVPALADQAQIITVSNPRATSVRQPAAVALQPAPQPAPQPVQPALVLRDVSAPASGGTSAGPAAGAPAPATNTRSSK